MTKVRRIRWFEKAQLTIKSCRDNQRNVVAVGSVIPKLNILIQQLGLTVCSIKPLHVCVDSSHRIVGIDQKKVSWNRVIGQQKRRWRQPLDQKICGGTFQIVVDYSLPCRFCNKRACAVILLVSNENIRRIAGVG